MIYSRIDPTDADVEFTSGTYTRLASSGDIITFADIAPASPEEALGFGPINSTRINLYEIDAPGVLSIGGNISILDIFQNIVINAPSQSILQLQQNIILRSVNTSNALLEIQQTIVFEKPSFPIIELKQRVEAATPTYLSRNKYLPTLIIGNWVVPKNYVHGNISCVRENNSTSSLSFTLIPPRGQQNPEQYQGLPVQLWILKDGIDHRIFTGYVDVPSIDLIEKKITFQCTDRRDNLINTTYWDSTVLFGPGGSGQHYMDGIKNIGYYSETIFGKPKDRVDELEKRLQTVPYDFNIDKWGAPQVTAWAPKTTADFSLDGSEVYYDKPEVKFTNRSSTVNKIQISVKYLYQRLHQQTVSMSWPGYSQLADWVRDGFGSFPAREVISQAAENSEWLVKNMSFTSLWPAQGVTVNGISTQWNPDRRIEYTRQVYKFSGYERDGAGNIVINADGEASKLYTAAYKKDANGVDQPVMEVYKYEIFDASSHLARSASWRAYRKFSQNVVDTYNLTVEVPGSEARYGEVVNIESYNIESEYNTGDWENSKGIWQMNVNGMFDVHTELPNLYNTLDTALNKAKTELLKSHRDCTVSFRRSLWPNIDLHHTVELETDILDCKGRVNRIEHYIDAKTGEAWTRIDLLLSRRSGENSNSPLTRPGKIVDNASYIGENTTVVLGTNLGKDPSSTDYQAVAKTWTGFIGNKTIETTINGSYSKNRTNFVEEFRVPYPKIPDSLLLERNLSQDTDYSILIPQDELETTF